MFNRENVRRGRCAWRQLWLAAAMLCVWTGPAPADVSLTGTFTPGEETFDSTKDGSDNVIGLITPNLYLGDHNHDGHLEVNDTGGSTGTHRFTVQNVLWLTRGSITIDDTSGSNGATARLTTGSTGVTEVLLGLDQPAGASAEVLIDGGRWNASTPMFYAGHGGDATINVRNGGVLNRNYLNGGLTEIELWLGTNNGGDRGDGTLNIRDGGKVYGNVVVGAGGTGELNVYDGATLGLAVVGVNDYLTVGGGDPGSTGTATLMTGATINNEYWNIGAGGNGTLNVQAGVTTDSGLNIRMLEGGGNGTLNLQSGVDMTVRNLRLNGGTGIGQVNLDNAELTVSNEMYSQGLLGGATTIGLDNNSTLNTTKETFIGWGSAPVTVNINSGSLWNTNGDIELGNGGLCNVNIGAGGTWNANQTLVGEALINDVRTSAGDSSDTGGQTFITMTGDAETGPATSTMYSAAVLSVWGSTTVTQNAHSNWRVMGTLATSNAATPSTSTTINLNTGSTTQWDQGITKGGGSLDINLAGGNLTCGDPGNTSPNFNVDYLTTFTGGTLRVTGNLVGFTPLPQVGSGMSVQVDGELPLSLLHNDATSGTGKVRVGTLVADFSVSNYLYQPSVADPGDPGIYFDQFRIDGGEAEFSVDVDFTDGVHEWTNFIGSTVTAHGSLVMAKTQQFAIEDTYELIERNMVLDGASASANFTDAPTKVSPGFALGGLDGRVLVKNNAIWRTGPTTLVEGASVTLESGGTWIAEEGYVVESLFGALGGGAFAAGMPGIPTTITGGTLEYGTPGWTPDADHEFNINTKLAAFTSGTLIVHGPIAGDFELAPGASASGTDFTGNVIVGGVIMPGASPASSIARQDFTVVATGTVEMELNGPVKGDDYDTLQILGNVSLDGTLLIIIDKAYQPRVGDTFELFRWDNYDASSGEFDSIQFSNAIYDGVFDYQVAGNGGETLGVLTLTEVPEPSTAALLLGLGAAWLQRRRR
jgi:hypothetical protein